MATVKPSSQLKRLAWFQAYDILTDALLQFRKNYPDNTERELFQLFYNDSEFRRTNLWIRKLNKFKKRYLDPIQIFASINNDKFNDESRTSLIKKYFGLLQTAEDFDTIDFTGCPTPPIVDLVSSRKLEHVDQIWKFFEKLQALKKNAIQKGTFRSAVSWYGVDLASFTTFLFWTNSSSFLPLDRNVTSLLEIYGKTSSPVKNENDYLALLELENSSLYRNITLMAIDTDHVNRLITSERDEIERYFGIKLTDSNRNLAESRNDFKIISIRPLRGCSAKYRKILTPGQYYYFYEDYTIWDDRIEYLPAKYTSIYNIKDIKVNVSAIAGKNGSGKSSLIELLTVSLNNIVIKYLNKKYTNNFVYEPGVLLELYFKSNGIYKVVINGNNIDFYKYDAHSDLLYLNPKKVRDFHLEDFFYSICVNHSQFALNENHLGSWIRSLFHKNDAYQTPVVLEPFREAGNIDVNVQEELLASRLLSNLLEREQEGDENSFRQLTPQLRAEKLKFFINTRKTAYLYKIKDKKLMGFDRLKDKEKCLEIVFNKFNIKGVSTSTANRNSVLSHAKLYILKKLVSISRNYLHYKEFFDERNIRLNNVDRFIDKLEQNRSHITYKLWQAVNFIKFRSIKINTDYTLEGLSSNIEEIIAMNEKQNFLTIELIPPSFLSYELTLTKRVPFHSLSSGEKQKIYGIQSILYHLRNINSVSENDNLICYPRVNIILDEIELYFHPELQRTFISDLLNSIKKIDLQRISGINISVVTHSPFILSDIPDFNILFLKSKDDLEPDDTLKTFGANIHELLINGFFMRNTIGDYALKKINEIISFHKMVSVIEDEKVDNLKTEYDKIKSEFRFIVENLGEEYIKKILENHLEKIEEKVNDNSFLNTKIHFFEKEIAKLKNKLND